MLSVFPFDQELWHTDTRQKNLKVLEWGGGIFSVGRGSLFKGEVLETTCVRSSYGLNLENAMSGEFKVMIAQTLEAWTKRAM